MPETERKATNRDAAPTVTPTVTPARTPVTEVRTRRPADAEERRSFRRAMTIGLYVWAAFFLVDQYLGRVVYPGAPLLFFFGLRILGELAIYAMYRLSFREDVSSTQLKIAIEALK